MRTWSCQGTNLPGSNDDDIHDGESTSSVQPVEVTIAMMAGQPKGGRYESIGFYDKRAEARSDKGGTVDCRSRVQGRITE